MINDNSSYQNEKTSKLSFCQTVHTSNNLHSNRIFIVVYFFLFNVKMDQLKKRTRQPSKKLSTKKKLSSRVMNFLGIHNKTK